MKATAKDLGFYSKKLIDTVSRGEEVVIIFHSVGGCFDSSHGSCLRPLRTDG